MNLVWNLILLLGAPVLLPWLWHRRRVGKEDAARWGERWGRWPAVEREGSPRIWVHAVSVGETMAAAALLRGLRARWPDAVLILTTITPTGQQVAAARPEADAVRYFPLDYPGSVARALDVARPDLVLLMEGEIWPNFLTTARRRGARVAVVNGRLSDRKFPAWKRIAPVIRGGLHAVDRFAMQSDEDAARIRALGVDPDRIQVTGNTKFDEIARPLAPAERDSLRASFGIPSGAPVLVCGSTREAGGDGPDEEFLVARAVANVRAVHPELRVVVAPRHLERAGIVADAFPGAGRRSQGEHARPDCILDTFGELASVYSIADIAYVGGSLVPWGGQSVFQPLAQGVPAVFGPHMNNQRDIAALAVAAGVGTEVPDPDALAAEILRVLALDTDERENLARRCRDLIDRNQGAATRCVALAEELLGSRA